VWLGSTLCGVAAWRRIRPDLVQGNIVAVGRDHAHRGLGRRLKQAMVDAARAAGARQLISTVHFDNDTMIQLNASFGAEVESIADDPGYVYCIINL